MNRTLRQILSADDCYADDKDLHAVAMIVRSLLSVYGITNRQWRNRLTDYFNAPGMGNTRTVSSAKSSIQTALGRNRVTWDKLEQMLNILFPIGYSVEFIFTWGNAIDFDEELKLKQYVTPFVTHAKILHNVFYSIYGHAGLHAAMWDHILKFQLNKIYCTKGNKNKQLAMLERDSAKSNLNQALTNGTITFDRFITCLHVLGIEKVDITFIAIDEIDDPVKTSPTFSIDTDFITAGLK